MKHKQRKEIQNREKLLALIISISLLFSISSIASATYSSDSFQNNLHIYSEECPTAAIEYAESYFLTFLSASIESGAFAVGSSIQLGSPFTIQSQSSEVDIYYFPIISDGTIIATFRVYKDADSTEYVGIMSKYLANELSSLTTSNSTPALLFFDKGNVMVKINETTSILLPDPEGSLPTGLSHSPLETTFISTPLLPLVTAHDYDLISCTDFSRYIALDITEVQGENNWCYAYAAATIIRTVTDAAPTALDIMELFYDDPQPEVMLTIPNVLSAGQNYGLSPYYTNGRINAITELEASRPVFIRCQRTTDTGDKKYHALVLRGYSANSNTYSVWNPWNYNYETMSMSTYQYVTGDRTYTWIQTVYNWQ